MSFIISVDGTCDYDYDQLDAFGVKYKKCLYRLGGLSCPDKLTLNSQYETLWNGLSYGEVLSCLPITQTGYNEYFDDILDKGATAIVHIATGSNFNSNYVTATKAALLSQVKFPRCQVYVIDSTTFSCGLNILIDEAITLRDSGINAGEAFVQLSEAAKKITTVILPPTPDSMVRANLIGEDYLSKGKVAKFGFTLINGTLLPPIKAMKAAALYKKVLLSINSHVKDDVYISNADSTFPVREIVCARKHISTPRLYASSVLGGHGIIIAYK